MSHICPIEGFNIHLYIYTLAFVPILIPFSPELVMFSDFEFRTSLATSIFDYLGQMYPAELEIKDTTDSNTSATCLWFIPVDRKGRSAAHFPLRQT